MKKVNNVFKEKTSDKSLNDYYNNNNSNNIDLVKKEANENYQSIKKSTPVTRARKTSASKDNNASLNNSIAIKRTPSRSKERVTPVVRNPNSTNFSLKKQPIKEKVVKVCEQNHHDVNKIMMTIENTFDEGKEKLLNVRKSLFS